jgi:predicted ArsR family transcriptional regulator
MFGPNPGDSDLHIVMAGSGRPYEVLTPARLKIVRALHDGHDLPQIAAKFGLTEAAIVEEIQPLVEAHLVQRQGDVYRPTFFVANRMETRRVGPTPKLWGRRSQHG